MTENQPFGGHIGLQKRAKQVATERSFQIDQRIYLFYFPASENGTVVTLKFGVLLNFAQKSEYQAAVPLRHPILQIPDCRQRLLAHA